MDLLHNQKRVSIQFNYLGLLIYIKSYFLSTIYMNSIADGSGRFKKPHFERKWHGILLLPPWLGNEGLSHERRYQRFELYK